MEAIRPPLPRTIGDLAVSRISSEPMLRLANSRVVFVDYRRVQEDFSELRPTALINQNPRWSLLSPADLEREVRACIDTWLLRHGSLISVTQANQTETNTSIATQPGEIVTAYRPPRYGRAAVAQVPFSGNPDPTTQAGGLLDLKGVGVRVGRKPTRSSHSHGLLELEAALLECLFGTLLEQVLSHAGVNVRPIPIYAVIDAGFDAWASVKGHGPLLRPAAILVRRAHRRPPGDSELPARGTVRQAALSLIEFILRQYGLTSSVPNRLRVKVDCEGRVDVRARKLRATLTPSHHRFFATLLRNGTSASFDSLNIQTTQEVSLWPLTAELVDLGHYDVKRTFERPLFSMVRDRSLTWGGALFPSDATFVQPRPSIAVAAEPFQSARIGERNARLLGLRPDLVKSRQVCHMMVLATRWRRGELNCADICREIDALAARATANLRRPQ